MTSVGWADGRMGGRIAAMLVLLSIGPSAHLPAQVSFHAAIGARYTTTMVHDSIVSPFDLRPTVAPALLLSVRDELSPGWSADVTLDLMHAALRRYEAAGTFDAGSFTAIAFMVGLRHVVKPRVTARVAAGGLKYAADASGIFRQGNGGLFPVAALGVTYAIKRFEVDARYDVHRFSTPALRSVGFTDARPVHRFSVTVSARVLGRERLP